MDDRRVIYLGSFSKTFAPGLRVGWVLAPHAVREKLVLVSEAQVLCPPTYNQSVVDQAAWVSHYNTGWTVLKAETRLEGFSGGTLFQEQRFVSNAYPTTL